MMVQPGAAAHHEQHNSLTNQCLEAYYITHRSTYEYIAMHVLSRGRDDPHKTINPPTGRVLHRVHHVKYGSLKGKQPDLEKEASVVGRWMGILRPWLVVNGNHFWIVRTQP